MSPALLAPEGAAANLLYDLPGCLISERELQPHALCRFENGLDRRFDDDSAARKFHLQVIADFVFAHLRSPTNAFFRALFWK